ncbi:pre-mRNA-splicing factor CLF1 [Kwoniella dejecticola CBS 10117]|uniref:Pre-mRNA-splicing factor CLF1 n=1 Tax=Kwoniella dejecticola CBS 10117 TaxID=1296121 RepID=A0A1A5ZVV6_9TREE|nr:pre-mRNA-splicing factor CLF1 [Kwoniella dejecticola CBS 10117]OBR81932.1 pre-mRNA-splicing factor CLF1 [Kwoniella dejecticola CBS 10117]
MSGRDTRDRAPRVKNRAAAAVQITAEQLLREAQERQEPAIQAPKQRVQDLEELSEFQGRKRTEFEGRIRYSRDNIRAWIKYAQWESSQNEFERARSVFERALDIDPRSNELWLRYTDMELKARNINHARNLYDRAVTLLPRVDALWYKYVYLEELLLNVPGARQIFERWMQWEPNDKAWQSYIKLEERYNELDRASAIYERWIGVRPIPKNWVIWAKFEEERNQPDKAREVFQTALEFFGDEEEQVEKAQQVFAAFARMETRLKEYERARVIYKFALARLPRSKSASLYAAYTKFEKQHGDRAGVELTVLGKRRIQYEEELAYDGTNYDAWFSLARLEEDAYRADKEDGEEVEPTRVREVYERAVANVPPALEKRYWRRYIYLWLQYAAFEEIETKDFDRARDVYKAAIKLVPHKSFTFAKLWLSYAYFEIRQLDVTAARKVLGAGIGMCPKPKLFSGYIELEMRLREFDRVRMLYEKFLTYDSSLSAAWIQWTQVESAVEDFERVRAIFELAVQQSLDMPEIVWKAYIDFESGEGEREKTRSLYERLLERTSHVKVYISYALMEISVLGGGEDEDGNEIEGEAGDAELARAVFARGYKDLRTKAEKEDRALLLEAWKSFEQEHGTPENLAKVEEMMPTTRKRWRKAEDGSDMLVEYWDLIFPDDERDANPTSFKFFQAAQQWAAQRGGDEGEGGLSYDLPSDSDEDDEEEAEEVEVADVAEDGQAAGTAEPMDEDD